jgi:LysM repeat protein
MRRRRSPARWLAPLALVACAVAVYTVVNATLLSSDEPATTSSTSKSGTTAKSSTVSERSKSGKRRTTRRRRTYTVKSGDTLSSIAVKTGVSLERIQALNPKLDSNSLQTGQRVKLSP